MHYAKMLVVPDFQARDLEKMCQEPSSDTKKGRTEFDEEVVFIDGNRVAIQVVGCGEDDPAWTQAVLFSPEGLELGCTETGESFLGEYQLQYEDTKYTVIVAAASEIRDGGCWPNWYNDPVQFCRLIGELQVCGGPEDEGVFTREVIASLAGQMDLPVHRVEELIDRGCDRWDWVKRRLGSDLSTGLPAREVVSRAAEAAGWSPTRTIAALCEFVAACRLEDQLDGFLSGLVGFDRAMEKESQACR